jgi:hypothetical protein
VNIFGGGNLGRFGKQRFVYFSNWTKEKHCILRK